MIDDLISNEKISVIVDTLLAQSRRIQAHEKNEQALGYAPYLEKRGKYLATGLLLSALAPNQFVHKGFEITDVKYGLNNRLCQPEIRVDNAIIQVYSNGSDLNGKVIYERCKEYNKCGSSRPQFLLMVVAINAKGEISRIDIRRPDKSGTTVEKKQIYTNAVQFASAI